MFLPVICSRALIPFIRLLFLDLLASLAANNWDFSISRFIRRSIWVKHKMVIKVGWLWQFYHSYLINLKQNLENYFLVFFKLKCLLTGSSSSSCFFDFFLAFLMLLGFSVKFSGKITSTTFTLYKMGIKYITCVGWYNGISVWRYLGKFGYWLWVL